MNGQAPAAAAAEPNAPEIPKSAHLMCAWPLLLVAVGGLVGGALGGLAYGINIAIYKSTLPAAVKVILNPIVGVAAIGGWLAIAMAIQSAM
jgi:hypothetical protein